MEGVQRVIFRQRFDGTGEQPEFKVQYFARFHRIGQTDFQISLIVGLDDRANLFGFGFPIMTAFGEKGEAFFLIA
ncbi:hypothetical protein SDC9_149570 [bioreactor metagenome]|uniref:Uncharacterized protein n=1 Tax=bioreactor metagenome TaxID=1076179 RepID=A0A645ENY7_9ZZZZ